MNIEKLNKLNEAYAKRFAKSFNHADLVAIQRILDLITIVEAKLNRKPLVTEQKALTAKEKCDLAIDKAIHAFNTNKRIKDKPNFCRHDYLQGLYKAFRKAALAEKIRSLIGGVQ